MGPPPIDFLILNVVWNLLPCSRCFIHFLTRLKRLVFIFQKKKNIISGGKMPNRSTISCTYLNTFLLSQNKISCALPMPIFWRKCITYSLLLSSDALSVELSEPLLAMVVWVNVIRFKESLWDASPFCLSSLRNVSWSEKSVSADLSVSYSKIFASVTTSPSLTRQSAD